MVRQLIQLRIFVVVLFSFTCLTASATELSDSPTFRDYPTKKIDHRPLKTIDFKSHPKARTFRTNLRKVVGEKSNFAGKYVVTFWGCGSPCQEYAIINVQTGSVYITPFTSQIGADYKVDSNLFVVNPKGGPNHPLFIKYYYVWDGSELKLVYTEGDVS